MPPSLPPVPPPLPPPEAPPGVIMWFRIWAATTGVLYLSVAILTFAQWKGWVELREGVDKNDPNDVMVPIIALVGASILLFCSRMKVVPENWAAGVFCCSAGLICCTVPAIILLIFWVDPRTKRYFQTRGATSGP